MRPLRQEAKKLMSTTKKLSIRIEMRWWTRYAILAVGLMCFVTRRKPSERTIDWLTTHGFTHKLKPES